MAFESLLAVTLIAVWAAGIVAMAVHELTKSDSY